MRLPKWPKSILNRYGCQMLVLLLQKCNPYPWKPYSIHKNHDSMYHGSKGIAKNRFWWLPMATILDSEITKMPSGCNHYTHLILKLHGTETPKMQRKDCYQTLQGSTTMPLDYNKMKVKVRIEIKQIAQKCMSVYLNPVIVIILVKLSFGFVCIHFYPSRQPRENLGIWPVTLFYWLRIIGPALSLGKPTVKSLI